MSHKLRQLVLCIGIPLAVGGLSGWVTRGAMEDFQALNQPPLSPPGWLFPVVWTVLFVLMGIASYLVVRSQGPEKLVKRALTFYGIQLGFNFLWSILFFKFEMYLLAFSICTNEWLSPKERMESLGSEACNERFANRKASDKMLIMDFLFLILLN